MSNADELRDLIQQVEDRGGPLAVWGDPDECQVVVSEGSIHMRLTSPFDLDALAGVLRRDANKHGVTFVAIGSANGTIVNWHDGTDLDSDFGQSGLHATEHLRAHLLAWLDAHAAGLVGRQEVPRPSSFTDAMEGVLRDGIGKIEDAIVRPSRDDLYDGRMPLDDD